MLSKCFPKILFSFVIVVFIFSSCKEEQASSDADLSGKWSVYEAYRNNQPTTTLQNAYFDFVNDSIMKTNILGTEMESNFELVNNNRSIRQYGNPLIEYNINSISQDTLELTAKIKAYNFKFYIRREN